MLRILPTLLLLACVCLTGCRSPDYERHDTVLPSGDPAPREQASELESTVMEVYIPAAPPAQPPAVPPGLVPATRQATAPPQAGGPFPPPSRPLDRQDPWVSLTAWALTRQCAPPRKISFSKEPAFELKTPHGALTIHIGSRQAFVNGMQLHLGFAPILVAEEPCLHELDARHHLEPLLLQPPWTARRAGTIVLDPGHGGVQGGTRSVHDGTFEKTYALDWGLRLTPLLEAQGWTVKLTRSQDVDVSLADRVAFAHAMQADLFISLHFNAPGSGNHQSGLETYCLTPQGMESTLTRVADDNLTVAFPNHAFDLENIRIAAVLHRSLLEVNGGLDRGIRRARFMTVLRGQNCPAVLIEGGYLSNPDEAARIADPEFRQQLAEAVARALQPPPAAPAASTDRTGP